MARRTTTKRFQQFLEEVAALDSDWEYSNGDRMRTDAAAHLSAYKYNAAQVAVLKLKNNALEKSIDELSSALEHSPIAEVNRLTADNEELSRMHRNAVDENNRLYDIIMASGDERLIRQLEGKATNKPPSAAGKVNDERFYKRWSASK